MDEIWKDVVGYEGLYQVSDMGRVRSLDRVVTLNRWGRTDYKHIKGIMLKLNPTTAGYSSVRLCGRTPKAKHALVHILVAAAFIGPCPPKHEVNHKWGIKTDNRVSELEYLTPSENQKHSFRVLGTHIRKGEEHHMVKLTDDKVLEMRRLWNTGDYTQVGLGAMFGVSFQTAHLVVRHKIWRHLP